MEIAGHELVAIIVALSQGCVAILAVIYGRNGYNKKEGNDNGKK